jgi:uncharacterized protein YkwD
MLATVRLRSLALTLFVTAIVPPALAQTQYSIGYPTNEQQYMLELINRARANGGAEAARLGLSGLQEGPPTINGQPWTINNTNQPLSWNPLLFNCAQGHATRLNNDDQFFSGQSPHTWGGTTPNSRIAAAGYSMATYNGPTTSGGFFPGPENVAEAVSIGSGPYTGAKLIAEVLNAHNDLFTDQTIPGRGHRSTTMLAFWREIGLGISTGKDNGNSNTWDSLYIVQNFGTQTNSTPFITGVVYQDTNGNGFYDPGEGIGGIRVDVPGTNFFAITSPSGGYSIPAGNGNYTATFSGGAFPNSQMPVTISNSLNAKLNFVAPVVATPTLLANVSTRLPVGTDPNALIAGFIITGTQDKKVIIRAIGPSLGLPGQLANPTLELRDSSGGLVASNDDWMNSSPADKQAIINSTIPPTNNLESAIVRTLPANGSAYTAIVRGVNNTTGIGVVEVYDLDQTVNSKLANILLGQTSQKVAIRVIGPSLSIAGKMADPTLQLVDGNGTQVAFNDNWRSGQEVDIIASGVAPTNDAESAIVATLSGNGSSYTAIVRGVSNSTGIAVVEVYALQ